MSGTSVVDTQGPETADFQYQEIQGCQQGNNSSADIRRNNELGCASTTSTQLTRTFGAILLGHHVVAASSYQPYQIYRKEYKISKRIIKSEDNCG